MLLFQLASFPVPAVAREGSSELQLLLVAFITRSAVYCAFAPSARARELTEVACGACRLILPLCAPCFWADVFHVVPFFPFLNKYFCVLTAAEPFKGCSYQSGPSGNA